MKLLEFFSNKKINPACSRNLNITFSSNNSYELDLFLLTEKSIPICIECKTGEFRQDIDKYLTLRKQLNIEKKSICYLCLWPKSRTSTRYQQYV
jgi:hypothetical protein